MEITGVNNQLVKDTVKLQQKKYRQTTGKFLLEGYKCIFEGVTSGLEIEHVFVLKEKIKKYDFIKDKLILTTPAVLKKISTTDTSPEAVAIAYQPQNNLEKLKKAKKVILLENISDAGNLGTIIRSASAFGIDSVILYGESVDIYNPKCVRSAVGNLWKTNIVSLKSPDELEKYFTDFDKIATVPKNKNSVLFEEWAPSEKVLVMFGSEADGLSDSLINIADKQVTIEMSKDVESLNLSVSASIVMYKMFKN